MPPCRAVYLVRHLFDVGPVSIGEAGPGPVSYPELAAWSQVSGVPVTPWEGKMLRVMSVAYADELAAAKEARRPCPWDDAPYSHAYVQSIIMRDSMRADAAI